MLSVAVSVRDFVPAAVCHRLELLPLAVHFEWPAVAEFRLALTDLFDREK